MNDPWYQIFKETFQQLKQSGLSPEEARKIAYDNVRSMKQSHYQAMKEKEESAPPPSVSWRDLIASERHQKEQQRQQQEKSKLGERKESHQARVYNHRQEEIQKRRDKDKQDVERIVAEKLKKRKENEAAALQEQQRGLSPEEQAKTADARKEVDRILKMANYKGYRLNKEVLSPEVIKSYRVYSSKYHPDRNRRLPQFDTLFAELAHKLGYGIKNKKK